MHLCTIFRNGLFWGVCVVHFSVFLKLSGVDFSGWWLLGILFGFMENLTGDSTVLGGVGGDSFWYEEKADWDFDLSGGMRGYSFCFE